jgi:hypothetical protein
MTDSQRCVVPGGGSGTATAFLLDSTFGFRRRLPRAQIAQAGRVRRRANGSEARAPKPFLACEGCDPVTSGRAPRRRTFLHFEELRPIPVGRNSVLGIAKLLPLIGPVKRETPYVVSSAMTALIRGKGQVFHTTFTSGLAEWRRVGREPAAEICGERSVRVDRCGGGEGNWVGRAGLG